MTCDPQNASLICHSSSSNHGFSICLSLQKTRARFFGSETEANLKDLFVFLTGSDRIPPMGFTRKGKIAFDHRDNSQELRFPSVSTCQPMLQLPMCDDLTQDYDSFKEKMNLAVLGSVGFGNP